MPKLKSNRGAAKRFKRSASGGFKRAQSHLRHILTKKSSKRKRKLRDVAVVKGKFEKNLKLMLQA